MLSTKNAKLLLKILIPLFIAVLSVSVLSVKVPEAKYVQESLKSIEDSNATVMRFTGVALGVSTAITMLPDDFATPLANSLADMNKYFVFTLMVLFIERLILLQGIRLTLVWMIPAACIIYVISNLIKNDLVRSFAYKLLVLALAVILSVPCSTHFVNSVCAEYLDYVDQTIDEVDEGAGKVNDIIGSSAGEQSVLDRLSNAFQTALSGIQDLANYFKNMIRKCITAVAILIVVNFVIPVFTFMFLGWLLKELFKMNVSIVQIKEAGHEKAEAV